MDSEAEAKALLDPGAYAYFAGGAGDERVLRENVTAWSEHRLAPRVLVDVSTVDPSVRLLGRTYAHPTLIAPMAYQRHAHAGGEVAMARAAAATGTGFVLSSQTTTNPREVAQAMGDAGRWFQLYVMTDDRITDALIDAARDGDYEALVLTVDFPVGGLRERDHASGFAVTEPTFIDQVAGRGTPLAPAVRHALHEPALTWERVAQIKEACGMPLLLKGILRADDAARAVDAGVDGIVVSNHGGRQLDAVLPTAHALAPIAEAVDDRIPVLVDGGIRRGWDVAIALALGADAVLMGRPLLWGLATDGQGGVTAAIGKIKAEFENALALVGCPRARDLDESFLA